MLYHGVTLRPVSWGFLLTWLVQGLSYSQRVPTILLGEDVCSANRLLSSSHTWRVDVHNIMVAKVGRSQDFSRRLGCYLAACPSPALSEDSTLG
ncbi:hypothetical protein F4802DRAFT_494966 [Xylaria palmicola]|nr:hypothetical protein F4802DRAFT_494966 [Xylaria palmicola]